MMTLPAVMANSPSEMGCSLLKSVFPKAIGPPLRRIGAIRRRIGMVCSLSKMVSSRSSSAYGPHVTATSDLRQRLDPQLSGTGASQDPGLVSLHLQNRAGDFVDGSGGPSPGWLGPTRTWTSTETSASDLMVHLRARRRSALSLLGSKLDA